MKSLRLVLVVAMLSALALAGCVSPGINEDDHEEEVDEENIDYMEWEVTCDYLIAGRDNAATDQEERLYVEPAGSCAAALVERTQARNEVSTSYQNFETPDETKRSTTIRFQVEYADGQVSTPEVVTYSANKNQEKQATAKFDIPSRGEFGTSQVCWYANALIYRGWWTWGWDISTYGPQPDCFQVTLTKDGFL